MRYVRIVDDLKVEFFFFLWTIFISCKFLERVWEIMPLPRYCLAHHSGISSNITNATHLSMPPTPPTLAHQLPYPHWHTTHVTHAGMSSALSRQSRNPRNHAIHASMPLTQAYKPRKHATTLPTLALYPCKHTTHANHTSMPPMQGRHLCHLCQPVNHASMQPAPLTL